MLPKTSSSSSLRKSIRDDVERERGQSPPGTFCTAQCVTGKAAYPIDCNLIYDAKCKAATTQLHGCSGCSGAGCATGFTRAAPALQSGSGCLPPGLLRPLRFGLATPSLQPRRAACYTQLPIRLPSRSCRAASRGTQQHVGRAVSARHGAFII
jgi:hypothetical protein